MGQEERFHVGSPHDIRGNERGLAGDQHGTRLGGLGEAAVGSRARVPTTHAGSVPRPDDLIDGAPNNPQLPTRRSPQPERER